MNRVIYFISIILIFIISSCNNTSLSDEFKYEVNESIERWTDYNIKIYKINLGDSSKFIIYDKNAKDDINRILIYNGISKEKTNNN